MHFENDTFKNDYLVATQINLENESFRKGAEKYRESVRKNADKGTYTQNQGSQRVFLAMVDLFAKEIEGYIKKEMEKKKASNRATTLPYLMMLEPEALAFITLAVPVDKLYKNDSYITIAKEVGKDILREIQRKEAYGNESFKKLFAKVKNQLKKVSSKKHKDRVNSVVINRYEVPVTQLPENKVLDIGVRMLMMLEESTGLFTKHVFRQGKKTVSVLKPSEDVMKMFEENNEALALLKCQNQPMVIPPVDWTNAYGGGYYTSNYDDMPFVKTFNKNYLEEMDNFDMSEVYKAINAIQRTAWTVNQPVFRVAKELWETNSTLGGLPRKEKLPIPAKPHDIDTNEEAKKSWKREATDIHDQNHRTNSKVMATTNTLRVAMDFKDFDKIYFPYTCDFRGRIYSVSNHLNPQGNDLAKALLTFSEGKPLGENGGFWLAVHIAGLFGVDKVSFDDRVEWVMENSDKIIDSAINPLDGDRFWCEADKPFQALAACFEWAGFQMQGDDYVSHLPIHFDGACNGLQNFSAMLRDPIGGKAVNLLPSDKPNDIYSEVAVVVNEVVNKDAEAGNEAAQAWIGNVTRTIVKRPVMTLPYGATRIGMRDQIRDQLQKDEDKKGEAVLSVDKWQASEYLSKVVYESIGKVVVAARQAMDWLQEVAAITASEGLPIHWTAPSGFPVSQAYKEMKQKRVDIYIYGRRVSHRLSEPTTKIVKNKQKQGISPNFVHACDASHLVGSVNLMYDNGIENFAMVHDSYGTHACDAEVMYTCIREAFVQQYTPNVLEKFRSEIIAQIPDELAEQIPPVPSYSDLNLELIRESDYFFA